MNSSPRSASPVLLLPLSVVIWILFLSMVLQYFFGAEVTDGWLVIGLLVTMAAVGILLILKDFIDGIVGRVLLIRQDGHDGVRLQRRPRHPMNSVSSWQQRSPLLPSLRSIPANRRRSHPSAVQGFYRRWLKVVVGPCREDRKSGAQEPVFAG